VYLAIHSISGEIVTVLVNDMFNPGIHQVAWHPEDIASGIYFYVMQSKNYTLHKKLVLLQ